MNKFTDYYEETRAIEQRVIETLLASRPIGSFPSAFQQKALTYNPVLPVTPKNARGLSFLEDVGAYLYAQWATSPCPETQNDFVTYLYPVIFQAISKSGQAKYSANPGFEAFNEIWQDCIIYSISLLPAYDPSRARVYTFWTLKLTYWLLTLSIKNRSNRLSQFEEKPTDAVVDDGWAKWLDFLGYLERNQGNPVACKLLELSHDESQYHNIANRLAFQLSKETGLRIAEIEIALTRLTNDYQELYR